MALTDEIDKIDKYIKNINIPRYHNIHFKYPYLKFSYQDLYLCENIVFNHFDKVTVINIKKFKLDYNDILKRIDMFIFNAKERNKTSPYRIKSMDDIDMLDYEPLGGWIIDKDTGAEYVIY